MELTPARLRYGGSSSTGSTTISTSGCRGSHWRRRGQIVSQERHPRQPRFRQAHPAYRESLQRPPRPKKLKPENFDSLQKIVRYVSALPDSGRPHEHHLPAHGRAARRRIPAAGVLGKLEQSAGLQFADYPELHSWACDQRSTFWTAFLDWCAIPTSGSRNPPWKARDRKRALLPNLRLNYAQCLLRGLGEEPGDESRRDRLPQRDGRAQRVLRRRCAPDVSPSPRRCRASACAPAIVWSRSRATPSRRSSPTWAAPLSAHPGPRWRRTLEPKRSWIASRSWSP